MASFTEQILAGLLIIFVISPFVRSGQIQINLSNDIPNENLAVYCKSNTGKDLGLKVLGPGTNFTWAGDINIPGKREIYLCGLKAPDNLEAIIAAFNSDKDGTRCGQECLWSVRHDGIYLYIPADHAYILQFHWRKY